MCHVVCRVRGIGHRATQREQRDSQHRRCRYCVVVNVRDLTSVGVAENAAVDAGIWRRYMMYLRTITYL
jgi:hypothetical protein